MVWDQLLNALEELKGRGGGEDIVQDCVTTLTPDDFPSPHLGKPDRIRKSLKEPLRLEPLGCRDMIQFRLVLPQIQEQVQCWVLDFTQLYYLLFNELMHRVAVSVWDIMRFDCAEMSKFLF